MVSFPSAIKLGFQRYFEFSGRSTRAEYWWWGLFVIIAGSVLTGVDWFIGTYDVETDSGLLNSVFGLATLIPGLAIGVRRLHDIDRSGWWILLWLISWLIIPLVVLVFWAVKKSDEDENKYGPVRQPVGYMDSDPPFASL